MSLVTLLVCGIVGTASMTSLLNVIFYFGDRKLRLVNVVGTLIVSETAGRSKGKTVGVGVIVYYTIGVIFSIPYVWLWASKIAVPTILTAVLYGAIHGVAAMVAWRIIMAVRPNPQKVPLTFFLVAVGIAHVFFGLGVFAAYQIMNS
jgi:hypothetical protein